jgi:hypothetical protein
MVPHRDTDQAKQNDADLCESGSVSEDNCYTVIRNEKAPSDTGCYRIKAPYLPVLRIHNILVWIRIRGSMPLTNGSGPCYFRH